MLSLLDRPIVITSGMAFTLSLLTTLIVWNRIAITTWRGATRDDTDWLVLSVGVAFFAISVAYPLLMLAKLGYLRREDTAYQIIALGCNIALISASLGAAWFATRAVCGYRALFLWSAAAFVAGIVFFFVH